MFNRRSCGKKENAENVRCEYGKKEKNQRQIKKIDVGEVKREKIFLESGPAIANVNVTVIAIVELFEHLEIPLTLAIEIV